MFEAATEFHVGASDIKFAPLRQDAEVFSITRTLSQEIYGKVSNLLEITIPRSQSQVFVEHRHPIGHVVEGNPQFGLTLANFIQQACVFHRDDRLCGEVLEQRNLLFGERTDFLPVNVNCPKNLPISLQWHIKRCTSAAEIDDGPP